VNARALGPRVGKQVQQVIQAAKAGDWSVDGDRVIAGGVELVDGEFEMALEAADPSSAIAFLAGGGFVVLDTVTTPELEAEGFARDVIRVIQDTRKAAGLDVSDRIRLLVAASSDSDVAALTQFESTIAGETLAVSTTFLHAGDPASAAAASSDGAGHRTTVGSGQYANTGVLVIDVVKSGAVDV
jgi:isoleucyl-tRNA synthetase